jgi:hypothetical protein
MNESTFGNTDIADEATTIFTITNALIIAPALLLAIGISVYVHTLRFVIRSTSTIQRSKWTLQQTAAYRLLLTSRGVQAIIGYQVALLLFGLAIGTNYSSAVYLIYSTLQTLGIWFFSLAIYFAVPAPSSSAKVTIAAHASSPQNPQRVAPAPQ